MRTEIEESFGIARFHSALIYLLQGMDLDVLHCFPAAFEFPFLLS
jgi:hypothetical protein